MLESLKRIEEKFKDINQKLCQPEVVSDPDKLKELSRARSELEEVVSLGKKYRKALSDLKDANAMLEIEEDEDMVQFLNEEKKRLEKLLKRLEEEISVALMPKDPHAHKNIIMEIRQGTGGEEAALFAGELMRMYLRYADNKGFKTEMLNVHETELGGIKEAIFSIKGKNAYQVFKYESGVHRVQRVPDTEASGRIHTSAATVAVLPEAEEVDVEIDPSDLRVDTYRASGAGGQHVNKTDSAIRITHKPTGIVVSCQDERSQRQNRDKAMKLLRAKLLEKAIMEQEEKISTRRKLQVGSGDRSEKIRTYNFPQSRVTDHRINFSMHNLESVLQGYLDPIFEALQKAEKEELLQEVAQ